MQGNVALRMLFPQPIACLEKTKKESRLWPLHKKLQYNPLYGKDSSSKSMSVADVSQVLALISSSARASRNGITQFHHCQLHYTPPWTRASLSQASTDCEERCVWSCTLELALHPDNDSSGAQHLGDNAREGLLRHERGHCCIICVVDIFPAYCGYRLRSHLQGIMHPESQCKMACSPMNLSPKILDPSPRSVEPLVIRRSTIDQRL